MNEYAVVRMNRKEAGEILPAKHNRRCRYYILAENKNAAEEIIESRWPECKGVRDSYIFVGVRENVPVKFAKEASNE